MRKLALIALLCVGTARAQTPTENLGGPGESCRARPDCKAGLKCLENKCVDEHEGLSCAATPECGTELKCIDNVCVNPAIPRKRPSVVHEEPPTGPSPEEEQAKKQSEAAWKAWNDFELSGVHAFAGITLGIGAVSGGFSGPRGSAWGSGADGAFDFAVRVGAFVNRHELAIQVSPFTYLWDLANLGGISGAAVKVSGTYGYFIPLTQSGAHLYYPIRGGIGFFMGGVNTADNVLFEARADLVGLGLRIGHVMLDLHAPSFRYAITNGRFPFYGGNGVTQHLLSWVFGFDGSYVF
jgi:hypothetical protein